MKTMMLTALGILLVGIWSNVGFSQVGDGTQSELQTQPQDNADNLVQNSGFESDTGGWRHWGTWAGISQSDKETVRTYDSTSAHTGKRSLRTEDKWAERNPYVLQAVPVDETSSYLLSFWAKSDKDSIGRAGAMMMKGKEYNKGAISKPVNLTPEWQHYTIEIPRLVKGTDNLGVYLAATASDKTATGVAWFDDVTLTQTSAGAGLTPNPYRDPVLTERADNSTEITADLSVLVHDVPKMVGGISSHMVSGSAGVPNGYPYNKEGKCLLDEQPEMEQAVKDLKLPMTRFYALRSDSHGLNAAIDKVAELCKRYGIDQSSVILEFEQQNNFYRRNQPRSPGEFLTPEEWAAAVRYSVEKGYNFHLWELYNEPWDNWAKEQDGKPGREVFGDRFKAVAQAVRQADPKARIGLGINRFDSGEWWNGKRDGDNIIRYLKGHYDFIAPHCYSFVSMNDDGFKFSDIVLSENTKWFDQMTAWKAMIDQVNKGRTITFLDTEWGMHGGTNPGANVQNGNIVGTLHRAVRMIHYARDNMVEGAGSWELFSGPRPGFVVLDPRTPESRSMRSMVYWLYYYFNRHVGDSVVKTEGFSPYYTGRTKQGAYTSPKTPVLITTSKDKKTLFVIAANGTWDEDIPLAISLKDGKLGELQSQPVLLSNDDLNASPMLTNASEFVHSHNVEVSADSIKTVLPRHSVLFVAICPKAMAEAGTKGMPERRGDTEIVTLPGVDFR